VSFGHQPRVSKQNPARFGGDYLQDLPDQVITWSAPTTAAVKLEPLALALRQQLSYPSNTLWQSRHRPKLLSTVSEHDGRFTESGATARLSGSGVGWLGLGDGFGSHSLQRLNAVRDALSGQPTVVRPGESAH
jgi:hypothetical protein